MMFRRICFACLLSRAVFGQETIDSLATSGMQASLTMYTNIEGATVFVDGDSIGVTPVTFQIAPGAHDVRILSDVANWLTEPISDSISVALGERRTLHYTFPQRFLLLSTPSGAEVIVRDSVIGTTPLVVRPEQGESFTLRKVGYEETPLEFANASRGILATTLKKQWQRESTEPILKESEVKGSPLKLYVAGAATIIAGATSAYFKVKSDNKYSDYIRTGNATSLAEVDRLDTAAGVALAATQISLGLFAYFLLSEW